MRANSNRANINLQQKRIVAADLRENGYTLRQISEKLRMSEAWVSKWVKKSGKTHDVWSPKEIKRVERAVEYSGNLKWLAKDMGRSYDSVRVKACRVRKELLHSARLTSSPNNIVLAKAIALTFLAWDRAQKTGKRITPSQIITRIGKCGVLEKELAQLDENRERTCK